MFQAAGRIREPDSKRSNFAVVDHKISGPIHEPCTVRQQQIPAIPASEHVHPFLYGFQCAEFICAAKIINAARYKESLPKPGYHLMDPGDSPEIIDGKRKLLIPDQGVQKLKQQILMRPLPQCRQIIHPGQTQADRVRQQSCLLYTSTLLEDDKHVWPPYNLAPVVRQDLLDKYPDVADILNKISAGLDTETVTELNAAVDVDKREYEEVAKEYYDSLK